MPEYKQCTKCILDTTVEDITFDENGVCQYCHEYEKMAAKTVLRPKNIIETDLKLILDKIKRDGNGKKYDCIIGISGGVDSTYLCLLAKKFGLNPLLVHFDNGWNSELAVKNIENIVSKLNFDLYTYVINWNEFKDLQLSYLKASVVDIEVPTDQLIFASLFKIARQRGIKTILSGTNIVTEFTVPKNWNFKDKSDLINLTNIHAAYGNVPLKNFPKLGLLQKYIYVNLYGIHSVPILNYVNYVKEDVKKQIISELEWKDYGGKHYESIFTRFYQGYILPKKFNIDKRKMHLSTLISSGQITREQALEELSKPIYDSKLMEEDFQFVLKKFDLSEKEFNDIMSRKIVLHSHFGSQWDKKHFRKYFYFTKIFGPLFRLIAKTGLF